MIDYKANAKKIEEIINEVRQNPSILNSYLEQMIPRFTRNYYKVPGTNINIITSEGAKAVEEALLFL